MDRLRKLRLFNKFVSRSKTEKANTERVAATPASLALLAFDQQPDNISISSDLSTCPLDFNPAYCCLEVSSLKYTSTKFQLIKVFLKFRMNKSF